MKENIKRQTNEEELGGGYWIVV